MLETLGHDVIVTTSRKEALNILKREDISHVISDYRMPGQMDFEKFHHKLEGLKSNFKLLVISGYHELGLDEILRNKNYEFLSKPYTITQLNDKLL